MCAFIWEEYFFENYCMCHVVVDNHMVRHMLDMMRLVSMRTCFSIRGEYVTHMKLRGISGITTDFSYIGQCDLINTCVGLLQVCYILGWQHV